MLKNRRLTGSNQLYLLAIILFILCSLFVGVSRRYSPVMVKPAKFVAGLIFVIGAYKIYQRSK